MRPAVVLDSGVLLALWDPDDTQHDTACAAVQRCLADGSRLVVPVTVVSQVLVAALRATPYAVRTIEGFLGDLVGEVPAVDQAVGRAAARLRADHPELGLGEALLVATSEIASVQKILTTNGRLADLDPRIRVLGHASSPPRSPPYGHGQNTRSPPPTP